MELPAQQFSTAFNAAPRPIRSFIVDGHLDAAVKEIVRARNLHVDVAGILENASSQMLVGIMSPSQVLGELVLAGIDGETGKGILEDLNKKIFIPVRDKVRHFKETGEDLISPPDEDEPAAASEPSVPTEVVAEPAPTSTPIVPITPAPLPVPPPAPTQAPVAYVPPVAPPTPPAYTPPVATPAPAAPMPPQPIAPAPSVVSEHPQMRTMATDMQAAKEHQPIQPFYMEHHAPTVAPPPAPAPRPIAPPPVSASAPQTPEPSHIAPVRAMPAPPSNLPGAPVVHEYSVDPYRESPE